MEGWRWKPTVAAAVATIFLLIQIVVPIARMSSGEESIQRFAWQMFSRPTPATVFTVVRGDEEVAVAPDMVLARARGDLDLERLLPPFLCVRFADAVLVRWDTGEYSC